MIILYIYIIYINTKFYLKDFSIIGLLSHETMELIVNIIWAIFAYIGILVMIVWWIKALYLLFYKWFINHKIPTWKNTYKTWTLSSIIARIFSGKRYFRIHCKSYYWITNYIMSNCSNSYRTFVFSKQRNYWS